MRVSLFAGADISTIDEAVARTRAAAADGFDAIWFPQTASIDAITAAGVAGREVAGIRLGTAVVPIQGRHPVPLAQQTLTAADAAGPGRFTLGIGVTHAVVSEGWYGIAYRGIVDLCREELEALGPLLSPARAADVSGRHLSAHITIPMDIAPPGLVLAALGPRMLALAGRLTDGTVTWMTGARTLARSVVPELAKAADEAGRPAPRVIVGLPVCVTADREGARQRVAATMSFSAQLPSYRRMLDQEGVAEPVDIAIIGSEDEVTERVAGLAAAGATELLANVGGDPDERARTRALLPSLSSVSATGR